MIRYTVTFAQAALQALARLWLSASDRQAITEAGDSIDHVLQDDAHTKGQALRVGLRQIILGPIVFEFSVDEDDRRVTIWSARHAGTLTNGR
ncbi:MAG: hypothetical protein WD669_09705 [Pirellulales bacterium]